jgi:hypothetical protein
MRWATLGLSIGLLAGCSCSSDGAGGSGGGGREGGVGSGVDSSLALYMPDGTGALGEGGGGGGPEVCDGLDNDADGVIDNVDAQGDGICDCLRIATIGLPGTWSNGTSVLADWLNARSTTPVVDLGNATLTEESLRGFQVIIAQDLRGPAGSPRTYTQAEADALMAWVEGGGGLFTMIGFGDPSEVVNINGLIAATGLHYSTQPGYATVNNWTTHPVAMGLTEGAIRNGYAVRDESDSDTDTNDENVIGYATGAASGQLNGVFFRGRAHGTGHILVWGDEWISYDSEWQTQPQLRVERLWLNSIKWLSPANECQVPILG